MNDWHLVNLFIPTLLPLVLLTAFFLFKLTKPEKERAHPLNAIKDGQLSWAGLGMCVNGLYELQHPATGKVILEPWATNTFWLILLVLLFHTFIAAAGPIFSTKKVGYIGMWATILHYRVSIASIFLTIAAGWLYSDIHLTTQL